MVQATNSVLNPMYLNHWNQISSSTGKGVETVMEVYEDYMNVLMHHFVDTFTRPFELVEKNIGELCILKQITLISNYTLKLKRERMI